MCIKNKIYSFFSKSFADKKQIVNYYDLDDFTIEYESNIQNNEFVERKWYYFFYKTPRFIKQKIRTITLSEN
jgi:hypothetical protein